MKTLFIILLLFFLLPYIVRLLIRFVAPIIIKRAFPGYSDKFYQEHGHHFQNRKEGEIRVEGNPNGSNKSKFSNKGEYVDYEEVKD